MPFSVLGQLGDTVLEHELDRRDRKSAYLPPDLQGYRVPRVFNVTTEQPEIEPKPKGKKGRGRRNHRNRQQQRHQTYTVQDHDERDSPRRNATVKLKLGVDRSLFTANNRPTQPSTCQGNTKTCVDWP